MYLMVMMMYVPSDGFNEFQPFYTDPASSWATNGLYREDCDHQNTENVSQCTYSHGLYD